MDRMTTDEIKEYLLVSLEDLGAWLYVSAVTTNSHYIKFRDRRMGSLTVRDHPGRKKYHYKWNLVKGYVGEKVIVKDGHTRYYYSEDQILQLVIHMRNYHRIVTKDGEVQEWSDKRRNRGKKHKV